MMDTDRRLRFENQQRLRELKRHKGSEISIFCSHDVKELEALQNRSKNRSKTPRDDGAGFMLRPPDGRRHPSSHCAPDASPREARRSLDRECGGLYLC
jgi:hypothetical protein